MKNGLGRDVNRPTRPSPYGDFAVTLPKSESEITQVIHFIWCGFGEGVASGRAWQLAFFCTMKNGLGWDVKGIVLCLW